jgi:hypothetical protein
MPKAKPSVAGTKSLGQLAGLIENNQRWNVDLEFMVQAFQAHQLDAPERLQIQQRLAVKV